MESKEKIIVVDWSIFLHMATYASTRMSMQATYMAMTMILGNLKKIGVDPCDEVIIACDYKGSWRKDYIPQAKADRQAVKDKSGIDWDKIYSEFNELLEKVGVSTNWNIVKIPHIECDDIMAVCCRYYKDKEVVLLTSDSDLEQCWNYDNVKIFSPHRLKKSYKIKPKNFNICKVIAKLVATKGHNNLNINLENEEDYATKELCVTLMTLPKWVEDKIKEELDKLQPKSDNIDEFPFNGLKERYGSLYNNKDNVITYEKCVAKEERKTAKKKKLKLKEKLQKQKVKK